MNPETLGASALATATAAPSAGGPLSVGPYQSEGESPKAGAAKKGTSSKQTVSEDLKKKIKERESGSADKPQTEPYEDSKGHCTIGYGHLIHKGACTPADAENYKDFDAAKAEALFEQDLKSITDPVNNYLDVEVTQEQFDQLVSHAYVRGPGNMNKDGVFDAINEGRLDDAANLIATPPNFSPSPGHVPRFDEEAEPFRSPEAKEEAQKVRDKREADRIAAEKEKADAKIAAKKAKAEAEAKRGADKASEKNAKARKATKDGGSGKI